MAEQKEMRLSLVAKKLNVGIVTIVEKLASKGHRIENNPNAKLDKEMLLLLAREYNNNSILEVLGEYVQSMSSNDNSHVLYFRKHLSLLDKKALDIAKLKIQDCIKSKSQVLELQGLGLFEIPEEISKIKNLLVLNLNNNNLSDITVIANQKSIKEIFLINNKISNIEPIKSLTNLTTLELSSNEIIEIESLAKLVNLEKLLLNNNRIVNINALKHLKMLRVLTLNDNPINIKLKNLKPIVKQWKSIEILHLPINIAGIPEGIEREIDAIREYFKSINSIEQNNAIKIILIGNTASGKSSLVDWLMGKNLLERKSTHGIRIINYDDYKISNEHYQINFFDFGGQDYYHAIHNLYLSHNALYLLLWQDVNDDSLVKDMPPNQRLKEGYWLGNIDYSINSERSTDEKTNVLLIQNKADGVNGVIGISQEITNLYQLCNEPQFHISLTETQKKNTRWESSWRFFEENLNRKIEEICKTTLLTDDMIRVRDEVLILRESKIILTIIEFISEVNKALELNRTQEELLPTLLYLRSAGYILWFREIDSLKDWIIIDPVKLSNEFLNLLENENLNKNQGILTKEQFKVKGVENEVLINILKEHKIIFESPKQTNHFVVPQYLPEQRLEKHLLSVIPPSFVIRFEHYMPFWKISHFIAEKGQKVENEAEYWRYGLIYREKGATILIRVQRPEILETTCNQKCDQKVYIHIITDEQKLKIEIINEIIDYFATYQKEQRYTSKDTILTIFANTETSLQLPLPAVSEINSRNGFVKFTQYDFIKKVQLSVDDVDFFEINDLFDQVTQKSKIAKTIDNKIRQIPALIFPVLGLEETIPKRIFISYSHADEKYLREFENHLSALKRNGIVEVWHDQKIEVSDDWDAKIMENIKNSDIVLGFISSDFMASRYIWEKEMLKFEQLGKKFVPIFVRPCDIDKVWFHKHQGAPFFTDDEEKQDDLLKKSDINWIINYTHRDNAYLAIVERLKEIINEPLIL